MTEQQQGHQLRIYQLKDHQIVKATLLTTYLILKTKFSDKPQLKWLFRIEFKDGKKIELEIWAPVELTSEATVSGFIAAVDGTPCLQPGSYNVSKYYQKTTNALWGIRKTPGGQKETILRFLIQQKGETEQKAKQSVVPNEPTPTQQPKPHPTAEDLKKQIKRIVIPPPQKKQLPIRNVSKEISQGIEEDLKYATGENAANEIRAEYARAEAEEPTGEQIRYGVVEGSKPFFFQELEVDVTFEWNTEFAAFLDHKEIPYQIEKSQIIVLFHSKSLKLLQEDTKELFHFVIKKLDDMGMIMG